MVQCWGARRMLRIGKTIFYIQYVLEYNSYVVQVVYCRCFFFFNAKMLWIFLLIP